MKWRLIFRIIKILDWIDDRILHHPCYYLCQFIGWAWLRAQDEVWQATERKIDKEIAAGQVVSFNTMEEFLADLQDEQVDNGA